MCIRREQGCLSNPSPHRRYETFFSKYNLSCAQILITESDLADPEIIRQVGETTNELMQMGIVPIISENDAVTSRVQPVFDPVTREVQWDNDYLASRLAAEVQADLLVMLIDIDGLYISSDEDDESSAQRCVATSLLARYRHCFG